MSSFVQEPRLLRDGRAILNSQGSFHSSLFAEKRGCCNCCTPMSEVYKVHGSICFSCIWSLDHVMSGDYFIDHERKTVVIHNGQPLLPHPIFAVPPFFIFCCFMGCFFKYEYIALVETEDGLQLHQNAKYSCFERNVAFVEKVKSCEIENVKKILFVPDQIRMKFTSSTNDVYFSEPFIKTSEKESSYSLLLRLINEKIQRNADSNMVEATVVASFTIPENECYSVMHLKASPSAPPQQQQYIEEDMPESIATYHAPGLVVVEDKNRHHPDSDSYSHAKDTLLKLKDLLNSGLISQADYDEKKAYVLTEMVGKTAI